MEYFDEPSFEDPRTLIIPTKNNIDPPAAGTQILVNLNKNFSYSYAKEKNVSLKEDNIWVYYVNTKTDTVPPEFSGNLVLKNADNPVITDSTDLSQDPSSSTLLHNSSINIDIKIFDGDSGPNGYFILKVDGKDASGNFNDNHTVTIPLLT